MTINYSFRCQIRQDDAPIGILLRYLLNDDLHPSASHRDLVLQAFRSFWIPFAYQAFGYDATVCQQHARSAVYQLQQHILYIQSHFGLEMELSARVAPFSSSTVVPVASVAVQESIPEISDVVEEPPSALILPDLDDDPFS